ncbi:MAG: DUF6171 family protein [Treponema sp.]|nr:DUF6171 family protein [Treponema sp.]
MTAAQAAERAQKIPIEPSLRADNDLYRARLECCASCSGLIEGVLCRWCGCFVQFRARPKTAYCPSPEGDKWQRGVSKIRLF